MFGLRKPLRTVLKDVLSDLIKDGSDSLRPYRSTPCFKVTRFHRKRFVIPVRLDGGYEKFKEFLEGGGKIKRISFLNNGKIRLLSRRSFPQTPAKKKICCCD